MSYRMVVVSYLNQWIGLGEILTGKPHDFNGKKPWFPVNFPNKTNPLIESLAIHGFLLPSGKLT